VANYSITLIADTGRTLKQQHKQEKFLSTCSLQERLVQNDREKISQI